jgi:hypothetical protein
MWKLRCFSDRLGEGLFGELLALCIHHYRQVHVGWGWSTPAAVANISGAGWGVEQISPAHHIGNPLCGIVHHYRKLVGKQSIGAQHDEIADLAFEVLRDVALQGIVENHNSVRAEPFDTAQDRRSRSMR